MKFNDIITNKLIMILLTFMLGLLIMGEAIYYFFSQKEVENSSELAMPNLVVEEKEDEEESNEKTLNVNIKGAVKKPGVYQMSEDSTINDLVTEAGGFTNKAYFSNISLSYLLTDELLVYVNTLDEYAKNNEKVNSNSKTNTTNTGSTKSTTTYKTEKIEPSTKPSVTIKSNQASENQDSENTSGEVENLIVNINTADEKTLMQLNGIGASKAQAIILYRETNGKFLTIEDIMKVKGIGESIYAKIKDFITV